MVNNYLKRWMIVCACLGIFYAHLNTLQAQEQNKLTDRSLGTMLKAMGLKPKLEEKRYDFRFKAMYEGEEWILTMSAVLSQNGESLWLMAWLDDLPKSSADVPRTALLRLLADNDRLGKGKFFAYISSNRRFVLQRVMINNDLTTAAVRDALEDLGGSVAQTYPHWSVANWKSKSNPESVANRTGAAKQAAESKQPVKVATEPAKNSKQ